MISNTQHGLGLAVRILIVVETQTRTKQGAARLASEVPGRAWEGCPWLHHSFRFIYVAEVGLRSVPGSSGRLTLAISATGRRLGVLGPFLLAVWHCCPPQICLDHDEGLWDSARPLCWLIWGALRRWT